jgi:hypothetical protein
VRRHAILSRCRTVVTPPNPPPSTTMRMFTPNRLQLTLHQLSHELRYCWLSDR